MEDIAHDLREIKQLLKELLSKDEDSSSSSVDDTTICIGTTGKGKKCTNKRIVGSEYCGMHGGNKKRKVSTTVTSGKMEKIIPVHTHHTDPSTPCDVCIQHGDVLDTRVSDVSYSLQERLAGMLRNDS